MLSLKLTKYDYYGNFTLHIFWVMLALTMLTTEKLANYRTEGKGK